MATYIRLTDYKSSDKKEQEFFNPENRYEAKQEYFEKIPGSPVAYWVSDAIKEIFYKNNKLETASELRQGLATGDNDRFLRYWNEVDFNKVGFNILSIEEAHSGVFCWFPFNKGGGFR